METLYRKHRRTQISEMKEVNNEEISFFKEFGILSVGINKVSISDADLQNGSPKIGDMIARNPINHNDQWLVAEQYYKDNFETLEIGTIRTDNTQTLANALQQIEKLEAEKRELQYWKESMMAVTEDLQLQEIGKVLNFKLGTSISENVLTSIKKLIEEKRELVEMLELASIELESGGKKHWEINSMIKTLIQKVKQ